MAQEPIAMLVRYLNTHGLRAVEISSARVALPQGAVEIWHESYGREFYGHFIDASGNRVELIELAKQYGIETEFMYADQKTMEAAMSDLATTLTKLVAELERELRKHKPP